MVDHPSLHGTAPDQRHPRLRFRSRISDALDPGERGIYTMRDAVFAEAFVQLNRDRVWAPDPAAERAEARVWTGALVLLALGGRLALLLNR